MTIDTNKTERRYRNKNKRRFFEKPLSINQSVINSNKRQRISTKSEEEGLKGKLQYLSINQSAIKINNKKRKRTSTKSEEESNEKLQHLSIIQSDIKVNNKKTTIFVKDEDEEKRGTHTRQHLSDALPHDIMLNILSRLPVKSLMRFRSVSRSWNYSIRKDYFFISMHLSRSQIQPVDREKYIFIDRARNFRLRTLDYNQESSRLERLIHRTSILRHIRICFTYIWGICNGLILTGDESSLYVLNPSTAEYRRIPCFEGSICISCCGFGYNPNTNDYVVVKLTREFEVGNDFVSAAAIYSLRNNSWKKLQNISYHVYSGRGRSGLLLNGTLHWVAGREENAILSFEIATEKFLEVACPDDHNGDMYVSQYQGKLCFFHDKRDTSFDLWVMNEYRARESWTKVSTIPRSKYLNRCFHI